MKANVNGIQSKAYISVHDMDKIKEEDEDSMNGGDVEDLNRRVQMADGKKKTQSAVHIGFSNKLGLDMGKNKDENQKFEMNLAGIKEIDQKSDDIIPEIDAENTDFDSKLNEKNALIKEQN